MIEFQADSTNTPKEFLNLANRDQATGRTTRDASRLVTL